MALVINTNVASLQAQKNLAGAQYNLNKTIDHLSSGLRITSAADDAAGMSLAGTKMKEVAVLNSSARQTQLDIAAAQTKEGYMNEAENILIRLAEIGTGGTEATKLSDRLDVLAGAGYADISALNSASDISVVTDAREAQGATANVKQGELGTILTAIANKSAEISAIQDVDVAEETAKLSRYQVLAQAGVAALAQANQLPQMALKLLG